MDAGLPFQDSVRCSGSDLCKVTQHQVVGGDVNLGPYDPCARDSHVRLGHLLAFYPNI